ncbi:transposase [Ensifer sp. ENS04]|nr:transposase [Ensifer sp. ENS04]
MIPTFIASLTALAGAFAHGELRFSNELSHLNDHAAFTRHLSRARRVEWVVYSKPPFGGPDQVLAYLGHYTHRVAIANSRIVEVDDAHVAFRWKDYRGKDRDREKTMRLDPNGAFFCSCSRTASTACATSAFSPTVTDGIGSVSAESSLTSHHHQRGSRRPPSHRAGSPTNAPTADAPCAGQGSPSRLFRRRGGARYYLALATSKDRQCAFTAQKSAPIAAIGSQRSPDHAKIRRCDCRPRRIRYRHQAACSTIPIAATNNPRFTSIWLM